MASIAFEPLPKQLHDFRVFLVLVWRHLNLPDPTPVQLDIAHFLQHGPRRLVTEAFRGVGKSWITAAFARSRKKAETSGRMTKAIGAGP